MVKYDCRVQHIVVDKDVLYQSGMEAASALDSIDMPEPAKLVRDTAEKMRDLETELYDLIAETS